MWLDRLAAGKSRPRFLRSRVSSSTCDRRQALTLAAGELRDEARAALTRSVAILFCAAADVNPALSDSLLGQHAVRCRTAPDTRVRCGVSDLNCLYSSGRETERKQPSRSCKPRVRPALSV